MTRLSADRFDPEESRLVSQAIPKLIDNERSSKPCELQQSLKIKFSKIIHPSRLRRRRLATFVPAQSCAANNIVKRTIEFGSS